MRRYFLKKLLRQLSIILKEFVTTFLIVQQVERWKGINNRIKLIMRQGYGFSNFDNFRERVLACFSNYIKISP
jgi:hypothetical protein